MSDAATRTGVKRAGLIDRVLAASAGQGMRNRGMVEGDYLALGIGSDSQSLNGARAVGRIVEHQRTRQGQLDRPP